MRYRFRVNWRRRLREAEAKNEREELSVNCEPGHGIRYY